MNVDRLLDRTIGLLLLTVATISTTAIVVCILTLTGVLT